MLLFSLLLSAATGAHAATNLYVSSYAGNVTSLALNTEDNSLSLSVSYSDNVCGGSPSWLTFDAAHRLLYCVNEGNITPNGSVSTSSVASDGKLQKISSLDTIAGPVSSVLYGDNNPRGLALAHYSGAVSTFSTDFAGALNRLENFTFTMASPGPNAGRQAGPHEHQAITDPTGWYILVPDLGADLVRVLCWEDDLGVVEHEPLKVAPGSGPRHVAFWSASNLGFDNSTLYMYVVAELTNAITAYSVTYLAAGGLGFKEVYTTNTFGGKDIPAGAAAAEIAISPDNRFLTVSNRNDSSFNLPNPDPNNSTQIKSDSLATYAPNLDGSLNFVQLSPAGGIFPRHFSFNKGGDKVAVALQLNSRVVILERNVTTGMMGNALANVDVEGQLTCVVWDES